MLLFKGCTGYFNGQMSHGDSFLGYESFHPAVRSGGTSSEKASFDMTTHKTSRLFCLKKTKRLVFSFTLLSSYQAVFNIVILKNSPEGQCSNLKPSTGCLPVLSHGV